MHKKVYFASDVHLGAPALNNNSEREKLFVDWLDGIKDSAEAVYLMGDIFDFWFEYRNVVPKGFIRTFGKIAELTDRGVPVHFFTGNHDVWCFEYFQKELGVKVYRKPIEQTILGKRFFLGHGDGLTNKDKGYLFLKWIFNNKSCQFLFALIHPDLALWLGSSWSKQSRLSKGIEGQSFKEPKHEESYNFVTQHCKQNNIDYYVFGHRHQLIQMEIDSSQLIILGDWIHYFSYGVFDGKTFELKKINITNTTDED